MESVGLDRGVTRTTAANGLTVLTESLPGVRSVAIGISVRSASAREAPRVLGVSHLLEHMVFKGTERYNARELAMALELRGGSLDAYTGRDHTTFQAHLLDEDLPRAVEVLTELVRRPLLRQSDLDLERNVVLEEINMVEDTPDDLVFDLASARLWPGHGYGYPILGTRETVGTLMADDLQATHRRAYYRGNCVVAAAGNLEHDALLELLAAAGWLDGGEREAPLPPVAPGAARRGDVTQVAREGAQVHMVFSTDTFPYRDPRRFGLAMLVNAFGGGMSSRLFQRIREELGLAYAVYAYQTLYQSTGVAGVYIGTQAATAGRAEAAIREEYRRLAAEALSPAELDESKRQLKGQVVLSLESPQSRMNRLAAVALHGDRYRTLDQMLAEIEAVTAGEIAELAAEYFAPERQTVLRLGPDRGETGNGETGIGK